MARSWRGRRKCEAGNWGAAQDVSSVILPTKLDQRQVDVMRKRTLKIIPPSMFRALRDWKLTPLEAGMRRGAPIWISNRSCSSARLFPSDTKRHSEPSYLSAHPPLSPRPARRRISCQPRNRAGRTTTQKQKRSLLGASARRKKSVAPRRKNSASWRRPARLKRPHK